MTTIGLAQPLQEQFIVAPKSANKILDGIVLVIPRHMHKMHKYPFTRTGKAPEWRATTLFQKILLRKLWFLHLSFNIWLLQPGCSYLSNKIHSNLLTKTIDLAKLAFYFTKHITENVCKKRGCFLFFKKLNYYKLGVRVGSRCWQPINLSGMVTTS